MTYTVNSPIIGKAGGTLDEVLEWVSPATPDERKYFTELFQLCDLVGFDACILAGQWAHETGEGSSSWWLQRRNPAGIGITGDPAQNAASHTWANGTESARAHVFHMAVYVAGDISGDLWRELRQYRDLDPRFQAVYDAGFAGTVRTISDLTGKWAVDPQYAAGIVRKANAIFPNHTEDDVPDLTFGKVPHPPFQDRLIPNSENGAWDDLGQRNPVGAVQHTMVGTLDGTDSWFRRGAASNGLTDYGVGRNGTIYRWNDPRGRRAGWANGGSDGLEGDGPLFVRTLGIAAINRDLVSIERDDGGDPVNTPFDGRQFEACAQLTAYWFDQDEVPWSKFPLNPNVGIVTHFGHFEFATKPCPERPVMSVFDPFQDRIRAIMKSGQGGGGDVIPPDQNHDDWPNGWTLPALVARWSVPRYVNLDSKVKRFPFNPKGPLPNAWVARAVEEGITKIGDIPKPVRIVEIAQPDSGMVATMAVFDGKGSDNWAAYRPGSDIAWKWVQ